MMLLDNSKDFVFLSDGNAVTRLIFAVVTKI